MKTTSIIQVFELGAGHSTPQDALIVRPPITMKVFRCKIFVTTQFWDINTFPTNFVGAYIANYDNANIYSAVLLTNAVNSRSQNNVIPAANATEGNNNISEIILDRRGVGYMCDTFYIWDAADRPNATGIGFIWEGEID
jgi:hypothetical protein